MGEIRLLRPETEACDLKGLEIQRQKRINRSSRLGQGFGLGERLQDING